ncbi:hypothetical protein HNV12_07290 [Methanococcoides sp. SA1]|nr:hypothetical protein [Methanococcoides sp. SA1]
MDDSEYHRKGQSIERLMQVYLIIAGFIFTICSELEVKLHPAFVPAFFGILIFGILHYILLIRTKESLFITITGVIFAIIYTHYMRIFVNSYDVWINPNSSDMFWPFIPIGVAIAYSLSAPDFEPQSKIIDMFSMIEKYPVIAPLISFFIIITIWLITFLLGSWFGRSYL